MYTVLALDPGGTSGWSMYRSERMFNPVDNKWEYVGKQQWLQGHIGPDTHHKQLYTHLELQHTSEFIVVYESFDYRNDRKQFRDKIDLMAREYIGVVRLYAQQRKGVTLVKQSPGEAIPFSTDSKLERAGIFQKPKTRWKHANDASRHLVYYLTASTLGPHRADLMRQWWKE